MYFNKATFLLPFTFFLLTFHLAHAASSSADTVWIIIKPLQCLSNPWEKEWLAQNRNQVGRYPRREEYKQVKTYFRKNQIQVLDFRVKPYIKGDPRCEACDCPRGDTFFVMINAPDVPKMVSLGYLDRVPTSAVPQSRKSKIK